MAESGVTYMSAHNQLFTPVVREAKRLLDEGLIGRLRWVQTQDCFVAGARVDEHDLARQRRLTGGR